MYVLTLCMHTYTVLYDCSILFSALPYIASVVDYSTHCGAEVQSLCIFIVD